MELRKLERPPKIIAMSGGLGGDTDHILKMATCLGADRVFRKPFSMNELVAQLVTLLSENPADSSTV